MAWSRRLRTDGLDLPALAVEVGGPILGQRAAIGAGGEVVRVVGRASACGWDDTGDAQFIVEEPVVVLAVVAGVGQQDLEGVSSMGLADDALKLDVVGLGAAVHHGPKD